MTREHYFEMCEMLGSTPIESEIPLELGDFPSFVQSVFQIYFMLRDIWEPMSGAYMGKDLSCIFDFFGLYDFEKEEQLLALTLLQHMDHFRSKLIASKKPVTKPPAK
jgi:hypothetical protein